MKTATVTAYLNTGYTGINVPDSPAIIENNYQSKQLEVINCLPLSGQVNVSIRIRPYDELHETDYIKLVFSGDNTTYWAKVNGYVYLSTNTVEVSLIMDYWLTLGGINNISSVSGITKRVHIPKADDKLFDFNEPDEMINPAKQLKSVCDPRYTFDFINEHPADEDAIVVMSTLDLYGIGRMYNTATDDNGNELQNAEVLFKDYTYIDPGTQQPVTEKKTVTIPKLYSFQEITYSDFLTTWGLTASDIVDLGNNPYGGLVAWVPKPDENDWDNGEYRDLSIPNIGYFDARNEYVQQGISIVHDCGVEDCLIDQYVIPKGYIDKLNSKTYAGRVYLVAPEYDGNVLATSLNYEYGNHTVRNKKLFTGPCNAYTVYANANSDAETFNPEVIELGLNEGSPIFRLCADLRHQGGAMMSPLAVNKDYERWYMNFVKEMEFQSAPIKYQGASGSSINSALNALGRNTATNNFEQQFPIQAEGLAGNMTVEEYNSMSRLGQGLGLIGDAMALNIGSVVGRLAEVGANAGLIKFDDVFTDKQALGIASSTRRNAFEASIYQEKKSVDLKNTYVAPQIKFQQSQTLRELVGNGFIIFKYQLSDEDLQRCDKLLTMYGYRHSKSFEKTDLTNRPAFNYIEAGDVHITTTVAVPKWVREGAEDQLVGCRIWHKAYDPSEYEDNE